MRIETTRDRVKITHDELQSIVKQYIEKETGRIIEGGIHFSQTASSLGTLTDASAHLSDTPKA